MMQVFWQILMMNVRSNDTNWMLVCSISCSTSTIHDCILYLGTLTSHHIWIEWIATLFLYFERAVNFSGGNARRRLIWSHTFSNRHLFHFISDPLIIPQFILSALFLFHITFPLLFFYLLLQCFSHGHLLLLSFRLENCFFISTLQIHDVALAFKLKIYTILENLASCFHFWKILFCSGWIKLLVICWLCLLAWRISTDSINIESLVIRIKWLLLCYLCSTRHTSLKSCGRLIIVLIGLIRIRCYLHFFNCLSFPIFFLFSEIIALFYLSL